MPSDSISGGNWDVAGNWSSGLPAGGDTVTATGSSVDNIGSLSLTSLLESAPQGSFDDPASVTVTGGTLTIDTVLGDLQDHSLYAGDPNNPTTTPIIVTIGTVVDTGYTGIYGAFGSAATLITSAAPNFEIYRVGDSGMVEILGTQAVSSTFLFNGGTFALQNPGSVIGSEFSGYGAGDVIEVPGTTVVSLNYDDVPSLSIGPASLTIVTNDGTYLFSDLHGSDGDDGAPPLTFTEAFDSNTGLEAVIAQTAPCYAAGTFIATPTGQVPIEALRVGDLVLTADRRCVPIRWIGHRRIDLRRHPAAARVTPIRIARDAFGPGAPWRDLLMSPDHAVYVDGVLIPIRYLCDGESIAPAPCETITYFHLELPRHDVLLANGVPAESYLDAGSRAAFDNGGSVVQAHPDFVARAWEAEGCAPLVIAGPVLDAVRARLRSISRQRAGTRQYQFG